MALAVLPVPLVNTTMVALGNVNRAVLPVSPAHQAPLSARAASLPSLSPPPSASAPTLSPTMESLVTASTSLLT